MAFLSMYMLSVMKDKRTGIISFLIKGILYPLSWIYSLCIYITDRSYSKGDNIPEKVAVPVISVGNITLGGTGKTPFAMYLADHFLSRGFSPAILIRGYGNDEDRMLRDELDGVKVFSGRDRVKNASSAVVQGSDIIILDDAFQHRKINRDVNILMLDASCPFGNGHIFPRGILREPISALGRADIIVLTKINKIDEYAKEVLVKKLTTMASGKPIVMMRHSAVSLKDVTGSMYAPKEIEFKKVCLLSGIADPEYFSFLVKEQKANISMRYDFPDHYAYKQRDIDIINRKCKQQNVETIITTAKDYIKIKELDVSDIEDRLFIMNIGVDIVSGKENLDARLNSFDHS